MRYLLIAVLSFCLFGCSSLAKLDVKADKDFYAGFKTMAIQKEISWSIKAGCYDGWGGFKSAPVLTEQSPIVLKSLQELSDLLSTSSVSVQMATIKEKMGPAWNIEDYNLGYVYCGQLKVGLQTGVNTAQEVVPIIVRIIGMFQ